MAVIEGLGNAHAANIESTNHGVFIKMHYTKRRPTTSSHAVAVTPSSVITREQLLMGSNYMQKQEHTSARVGRHREEPEEELIPSNANLVRGYSNFVYVKSLTERHRMVLRSELGAVYVPDSDRGKLAPSLNFFAGGSQSIRGYAYQSLGNEIFLTRSDGSPR